MIYKITNIVIKLKTTVTCVTCVTTLYYQGFHCYTWKNSTV